MMIVSDKLSRDVVDSRKKMSKHYILMLFYFHIFIFI